MNKLKLIALVTLFSFVSSVAYSKECLISGKWKSHQEKTLANMANVKMTKKQRKVLSNNFFGKLVYINTCNESTSYFEGEKETTKFISMKEKGNIVITEYFSSFYNKVIKEKAIFEGECYSTLIQSLGFREVFCRVK